MMYMCARTPKSNVVKWREVSMIRIFGADVAYRSSSPIPANARFSRNRLSVELNMEFWCRKLLLEGRRLCNPKLEGASQEPFLDKEVVGVLEDEEAACPFDIVGLEFPDDSLVVDLQPFDNGLPKIISSFRGT